MSLACICTCQKLHVYFVFPFLLTEIIDRWTKNEKKKCVMSSRMEAIMTLQITLSSLNWHHSELVTCYVLHSLKVFLLLDWVSLKSKESSLLNLNYSWSETRRIHVFPKGISEKDCNQLTHNLNTTDSIFCASNHYATHKFVHSTVNLKKKKTWVEKMKANLKLKPYIHSANSITKWRSGTMD